MNKIMKMIRLLSSERRSNGSFPKISIAGRSVTLTFADGRSQMIQCERSEEKYVLESTILDSRRVQRMTVRKALMIAWERNRIVDIVAFDVDDKLRLVGRIQQLAETIDPEEVKFYIDTLARECDEFEYMLTGQDMH